MDVRYNEKRPPYISECRVQQLFRCIETTSVMSLVFGNGGVALSTPETDPSTLRFVLFRSVFFNI